jgi:cell wall-associated NlpC family hydrolase
MARRSLLIAAVAALLAGDAHAAPRRNVMEAVTTALRGDEGFTPEQRRQIAAAIRERFADYAVKVVRRDESDVRVLLHMVAEGALDNVPPERIAEVAFAAYQAVSRGADPDVVEGIGLYGYRKKIPGDTIATWANGYREATENGVPSEVAADLVRNAMEHDWDGRTFNTLKWALVDGQKRGFEARRYAAFIFTEMEKGKQGPGAISGRAQATFANALREGKEVPVPDYRGAFTLGKEPAVNPLAEEAVRRREQADRAAKAAAERRARAEAGERAASRAAGAAVEREAAREALKKAIAEHKAAEKNRKQAEAAEEKAAQSIPASAKLSKVWPDLDRAVRSYLGTPYVWGGETKRGIDCSGLTKRSYQEGARVGLPRNSRQQWKTGAQVEFAKLQEGDLVFFNTMGQGVSHVGMLVDAGRSRFIHASSSHGVIEEDLGKSYFRKRYLGARRVLGE